MFDNATLFALLGNKTNNTEVVKIPFDQITQNEINTIMVTAFDSFTQNKEIILFDGNYKVEDDNELLMIERVILPEEITNAIRNPLTVRELEFENDKIKAMFVGEFSTQNDIEILRVAFQKFSHTQYISRIGVNMFLNGNTFRKENKKGFSILKSVHCVFNNGTLIFEKYKTANEIIRLSEYYKEATQSEINEISAYTEIFIPNEETFRQHSDNQWFRKRLKVIKDNCVLQNNTAVEIKSKAAVAGVNVLVNNNKLVFPENKNELKTLLGFLADEVFKGSFSNETYMTNSKKKITN